MSPADPRPQLTLFDLDHTLLDGDSDVLWCEFLMDRQVLAREEFESANAAMEARYRAGQASPQEFSRFYLATLVGRPLAGWLALRRDFLQERVLPRVKPAARELLARHRAAGDLLVLTTATNHFLTELTAQALGFEHLIATDYALRPGPDGACVSGEIAGVANMREGKVQRLHAWLTERGQHLAGFHSRAYSDSINDLPLLSVVDQAVAVDPDALLAAEAARRGWAVLALRGGC